MQNLVIKYFWFFKLSENLLKNPLFSEYSKYSDNLRKNRKNSDNLRKIREFSENK